MYYKTRGRFSVISHLRLRPSRWKVTEKRPLVLEKNIVNHLLLITYYFSGIWLYLTIYLHSTLFISYLWCQDDLIYCLINYYIVNSLLFTFLYILHTNFRQGPLWSWSYSSWIYNYLCNQCLSPLKLKYC